MAKHEPAGMSGREWVKLDQVESVAWNFNWVQHLCEIGTGDATGPASDVMRK